VLTAWRSREQAYHMKKKFKKIEEDREDREDGNESTTTKSGRKRKQYDGIGPERMPDEYFNKDGDFDLSQVQGEKARQYFERVLKLPLPPGITRQVADDDTSREIRQAYGLSGSEMPNTRR
jgi:hypothetical protein